MTPRTGHRVAGQAGNASAKNRKSRRVAHKITRSHPYRQTMELIDIGANLTHRAFRDDLSRVLSDAWRAGVDTIIVTGTDDQANEDAQRLARQYPEQLRATAGIHPHHARHFTAASEAFIREAAGGGGIVAVGECGLDYNRDYSPRPAQASAFERQLQIAADCGLPVFTHMRDAYEDFIAILKNHRPRLPAVVAHCFTGRRRELEGLLELDCHIGLTGWFCDERRGRHLHDIVHLIPADRLMIETDAPWLLPRDMRPPPADRRNAPAFLPHIACAVAAVLAKPAETLAAETTATARAFFRLDDR